jgi:hypothetical protein
MRWHGQVLGGFNMFRTADDGQSDDTEQVGQAFADVATLVVVRATEIPVDQVVARVHEAVTARSVVEQARERSPICTASTWRPPTGCCRSGRSRAATPSSTPLSEWSANSTSDRNPAAMSRQV